MITRLKIHNFQICEFFDEELDPGINVFVGQSGRGKSARAIRAPFWLAFNKPVGTRFMYDQKITGNKEWKSGDTLVSVWTDDGHCCERIRGNSDNLYRCDGVSLSGFSQTVPEEITKALNLTPLHFQTQHARRIEDERFSQCNPLFLLSMSPSEVARFMNELGGIDEIDDAFSIIEKRIRREETLSKTSKAEQDRIEEELKEYSGLEELEREVLSLRSKNQEIEEQERKINMAVMAVAKLLEAEEGLSTLSDLPELKREISRLENKITNIHHFELEISKLKGAISALEIAEDDLKTCQEEHKQVKERYERLKPDTCPLCGEEWK